MAFPTSPSRGQRLDDDPASASAGGETGVDEAARLEVRPVETSPAVLKAGRIPWTLVAVVVAAAVGLAAVGAIIGGAPAPGSPSPVIGRVPANASVFAEVRLDRPGDQAANLDGLLRRLPTASDSPLATDALSEDLAQLVRMADGVYVTGYHPDVRGWVGRSVAIAVLPPADPARPPSVLVLIDVTDADAARGWVLDRLSHARAHPLMDTYNGTPVIVEQSSQDPVAAPDGLAAVVDGRTLLIGGRDAVRAAIDVKPGADLGSVASFSAARQTQPGEGVAMTWLDVRGLSRWLTVGSSSREPGLTAVTQYLNTLPDWIAVRLRAERDAVVLERVSPPMSGGTPRANAADVLAWRLPASTLSVVDAHDLGRDLQAYVNVVRSASTSYVADVEAQLEVVGGLESILAQLGTADAVVVADRTRLLEGLVAQSTDPAATERLVAGIASWARGSGMPVTTGDHAGAAVTTIDLGRGSGLGDQSIVQLALRGDLFVAGVRDFVAAILDTDPAASLATQDRYRRVMARVGTPNTQSCYADIEAWVAFADRQAASSAVASTYSDARPWLIQLEAFACGTVAGNPDRTTVILTVKASTP